MKNYDEIISLGTQCNLGLSLRELNLKKETYRSLLIFWMLLLEKIYLKVITLIIIAIDL